MTGRLSRAVYVTLGKGEGIFPVDGSGLLTLLRVFVNNSTVIWGLQAHLCSGTWDIEILEVRSGSKHRQQHDSVWFPEERCPLSNDVGGSISAPFGHVRVLLEALITMKHRCDRLNLFAPFLPFLVQG